jgi:hypothetical protein
MAFTGYRVLGRKRPGAGAGVRPLDWAVALVTLSASAAPAILGLVRPTPFWDRPPANAMHWWFNHMGGKRGSSIACLTAFSVINVTLLPLTVRWLWPTLLGLPTIAVWSSYYRRRFASRRGPHRLNL